MTTRRDVFTWAFLDEVAWWALGLACLAALGGAFVTRWWTFPVSCLLVAGVDLVVVHSTARRGGRLAETGGVDQGALGFFVGGRLAFKALALGAALLWPRLLDFWGVAVGAVTYDATLMVVGSVIAADRLNTTGR